MKSLPRPALGGERIGVRDTSFPRILKDVESAVPSGGLHRTMLRIAEAIRFPPKRGEARKLAARYFSASHQQSAPLPSFCLILPRSSVQLSFEMFSIIEPAAPSAVTPADASVA